MEEDPKYDLEERTFQFALQIRLCIARHKWTPDQWTDIKQVLRSSGSVAAIYTEANNAFSKADFFHRIGICKKESGESKLWLRLLGSTSTTTEAKSDLRIHFKEADELVRIFSKIHGSSQ
ncbi:four helix bundle protein [Haloferula chungangensis]|uniref:Four helix bundle protein n=1 Tax=Haloferula chungangensis TaxID=1048331 RepID=A0ABW2L6J0_9BACT